MQKRLKYRRHADHGDRLVYSRGCRCDLCNAANARYVKQCRSNKIIREFNRK